MRSLEFDPIGEALRVYRLLSPDERRLFWSRVRKLRGSPQPSASERGVEPESATGSMTNSARIKQ